MKIETEVKRTLKATDGQVISERDTVIYTTSDGKCHVGIYKGLTKRGALILDNPAIIGGSNNVMSTTIEKIFVIDDIACKHDAESLEQ